MSLHDRDALQAMAHMVVDAMYWLTAEKAQPLFKPCGPHSDL
jgi:hypothetical protein